MSPLDTIARTAKRLARALGGYAGGVNAGDLQRLFGRDARQAYQVLTRDHAGGQRPAGRLRRFLQAVRLLFLGMSSKLRPARRVLFVVAMTAAVLSLARVRVGVDTGPLEVDFAPLWSSISIATLTFLLALELVDRILVRELEVARQLQRELLPSQAPAVAGYTFAFSYRTANEVGGDYYEFTPQPDGKVVLAIGDASGHGIAAGLLMAITRAALQLAVDVDPAPESVARMLNRVLCRTGDRRSFMTLFYGLLQPASGELTYVCAGHPFPLLRRSGGDIVELGLGSLPLGLRETLELTSQRVVIRPGDVLLLYSDGLPEAIDRAGVAFGFERLRVLLTPGGKPQAIHDRLDRALLAHLAGEPPQDDVSLVVIAR